MTMFMVAPKPTMIAVLDYPGIPWSIVSTTKKKKKHHALKRERERRAEEIRTKLQSMCFADLLGTIFQAQEERVATYKMFEG